MNLRVLNAFVLSIGFGALLIIGCGDASSSDAGSGASCKLSSDCPSNELCLAIGSVSTCALNCTANADACGGSASCEGVGQVSVNVCQEKKESPSETPSPEETPKLPCADDAECSRLEPSAVCGQWKGARDCTIKCSTDDVCNPPEAGGLKVEFFACQQDEGDMTRTVCLPREECFKDPNSCITFSTGGPGGFGGGPPSGF